MVETDFARLFISPTASIRFVAQRSAKEYAKVRKALWIQVYLENTMLCAPLRNNKLFAEGEDVI